MHYQCAEKLWSAHRYGHSVFTRRKIIDEVCTIVFWDMISCILLPEWYITCRLWPQEFQVRGVTIFSTAVEILNMSL